jgi:hypothetical protein
MQDARDTFYVVLRGRLAALNPSRTIVVRGQVRPGILVEENELATTMHPPDAFCLRWTAMSVDASGPMPLVATECEIHYATDGTAGNGGMDRGRLLAAMDGELAAALGAAPQSAIKMNYSGLAAAGAAPVAMGTNIFWSQPKFEAAIATSERLARVATVQVFSYQEAGEL